MNNSTKSLSALAVAEYLILKSQQEGKPITNKKLQKLLYYSQAWSLVLRNQVIFEDKIEAWVHGPAIRSVYLKYKEFGASKIEQQIDEKTIIDNINSDVRKLIDQVWSVYGKYDGSYLELLTHSERPWQKAREGLEIDAISTNEINLEEMKSFYSEKKREAITK